MTLSTHHASDARDGLIPPPRKRGVRGERSSLSRWRAEGRSGRGDLCQSGDCHLPNDKARELRKRLTPQEVKLWVKLRELKPLGFHFRRQAPRILYRRLCFIQRSNSH